MGLKWVGRMLLVLTVVAGSLVGTPSAEAKYLTFKLEKGKASFDVPDTWQTTQDLFGMPLMILGPMESEEAGRPTITITTTIDPAPLSAQEMKRTQEDYQDGRREWAKGKGGEVLSFVPYHTQKWAHVPVVHCIGVRFQLNDKTYLERTYMFKAGENVLYYMKSLVTEDQVKQYGQELDAIVKSLKTK